MAGAVAAMARSASKQLGQSTQLGAKRALHSSAPRFYDPDYMHAKHMYNIGEIKNRGLKFGIAVWGCVAFGIAVPMAAVVWQQKKAGIW